MSLLKSRMPTRDTLTRYAVAAGAGALQGWIAPPSNLHELHWFALLPVFWALRPDDRRTNLKVGYVFGVFSLALIFRWLVTTITLFSNLPAVLAVVVLFAFAGVFGAPWLVTWGSVMPLRRAYGAWWVALFPTVLVAVEFLSAFVLLFPFQQGVSMYRVPSLWQLASVTGVWGLSWLVGFANASLAEAWYRYKEGRGLAHLPLAAAVIIVSLVAVWGTYRHAAVEHTLRTAPVMKVAQLQSEHDMVHRMSTGARPAFQGWIAATRAISPGDVDLVVWPEGASPYDLQKGTAAKLVSGLAKRGRFEMIIGGGTRQRVPDAKMGETKVHEFNSVYFFDNQGTARARYDKMIPLPFGEYFPLSEQLPFIADLIEGIGNFRAGEEAVVFEGDKARMASPICYEAIFGRVCRRWEQPDLLVNVTNDAWFGDTAAPHQHGMLAALRATELGIPMFRSAYSGISMVVEPHGNIYAETQPFTRVNRNVEIRLARIPTIYAAYGDWFAWLCALIAIASMVVAPWRTTRSSD